MAKNYPWSAGDTLEADDLNDVSGVDTQTAGETINGATTPVPIYIDNSDDEWYECDSDDLSKLEFSAFAISNGTNGNPIDIQSEGICGGFTGLTKGAKYYVQSGGGIGTTEGTNAVLVGIAISTTEILIIKDSDNIALIVAEPSDNLKESADTERSSASTTYVKIKEFIIRRQGQIRVKFDLKEPTGTQTAFGKVYINDIAVGVEKSTSSSSYVTQSDDVYVEAGNRVSIYIKTSAGGNPAFIENARLYFDEVADNKTEVLTD